MVWQLTTLPSASRYPLPSYIMTNLSSPQLPEFESDEITINTKNFSLSIARHEWAKVIAFCRENHITQDYYMFEFMEWK